MSLTTSRRFSQLPSLAIGLAGIVHFLIAPEHMAHSPAHGIFFGFAGMMEFGWAIEYRRDPSRRIWRAGVALAGGLIVLWALTRIAGAPFGRTTELSDWSALLCKVSEAAGVAGLLILARADRQPYARLIAEALGLALAFGLLAYGLGKVAEIALPQLGEPVGPDTHAHADVGSRYAARR